MKEATAPQIQYQITDEQVAERERRLEKAFDLLFEEVLSRRSKARNNLAPTDSTPTGGRK
ncbi:hypothetical protein BRDID11004_75210 [Bradyrhizobium diazoefficiens]|uniref:Uncharacterized protein n=1 Tax=Bradyrhizobium diazoefficiens TaxID=1355477 RepID=A0A809ZMU8_9BRAD|nr:hypothetical protein BD122_05706 [Bradyrhizobium diazoefficiens]BBZ91350.1 hypothetical protein F07S3_11830 [Bradyrhizobium diazoefficiens]BCA09336.1 hypothetical protein BDHF08_11830 [Bradyrhizobium diazoefficiens]BCE53674.1 hypothetical protein XF5B_11860 [Bradyrhizobium diazoefficiens]BCE62394.1 hypothetical protein XF6B_11930 [Bradyrhizobium diazoefficiens]